MVVSEGDDSAFLLLGEPVVAWQPGIVLVDLAVALFPVVELGSAQADPAEETAEGDVGLVGLKSERFRPVTLTAGDLKGLTILEAGYTYDGDPTLLTCVGMLVPGSTIGW